MKRKFFIKNLVLFTVPLLIPLLVLGYFSISTTLGYIRNDIDKSNVKSLHQTQETVELIFNEMDALSVNFEMIPAVIVRLKDLLEGNFYNYDNFANLDNFTNMFSPPSNTKPYIQSIYVYYQNSRRHFYASNFGIASLDDFLDTAWYDRFVANAKGPDLWIESRGNKQYSFETGDTRLITVYKKLHSPGSGQPDGVIVMNLKASYIENLLRSQLPYEDQSIMIAGDDMRILAGRLPQGVTAEDLGRMSRNPSGFFSYQAMNTTYTVSQMHSSRYQLSYISVIPRTSMYRIPIQLLYISISLLALSFLLGACITFFVTRKNYRNLMRIVSAFESAERGEPLPALPSRIQDEYNFILQNIVKTFLEQSYLQVQLSEKKYRLKTSEMMALQSQINPHFLFNTLKTLFWKSMALTGDHNDVSRMIEQLSGILHYSLGNSENQVPLAEEILNTRHYIDIQKVRYPDKFSVIWQYDDRLEQVPVMKLLLQPLIENSIYHGIKEKEGYSYIKIKAMAQAGRLRISVIDTGLGMRPETLEKLRNSLEAEGDRFEHIGLFNTRKRLKLMYGDDAAVLVRSRAGLGTSVVLWLPLHGDEGVN